MVTLQVETLANITLCLVGFDIILQYKFSSVNV